MHEATHGATIGTMREEGRSAPLDPLLRKYIDASNNRLAHPVSDESRQMLLSDRLYGLVRIAILLAVVTYLVYVHGSRFSDVAAYFPNVSFFSYIWGYITHEGTLATIVLSAAILLAFLRALRRLTHENWKTAFALGLVSFVLAGLPTDVFFGEYENAATAAFISMFAISVYLFTSTAKIRISGHLLPIVVTMALFATFWGVAAIGNELGMTGDGSLYWFILGYVPVVTYALPAVLIGSVVLALVRKIRLRSGWRSRRSPLPLKFLFSGVAAVSMAVILWALTQDGALLLIPLPGLLLALLSIVLTDRLAQKWSIHLSKAWQDYISPTGRWLLFTTFLAFLCGLFLVGRYPLHIGDNFMNQNAMSAIILPWIW